VFVLFPGGGAKGCVGDAKSTTKKACFALGEDEIRNKCTPRDDWQQEDAEVGWRIRGSKGCVGGRDNEVVAEPREADNREDKRRRPVWLN